MLLQTAAGLDTAAAEGQCPRLLWCCCCCCGAVVRIFCKLLFMSHSAFIWPNIVCCVVMLYNVHYVIMLPTANTLSLPHNIIKLRQWRSSSVDVLAAL